MYRHRLWSWTCISVDPSFVPYSSVGKEFAFNVEDLGLILGW